MEKEQVVKSLNKNNFRKVLLIALLLAGTAFLITLSYQIGYEIGYSRAMSLLEYHTEPTYDKKTETGEEDPYDKPSAPRSGRVLTSSSGPGGSYIFRLLDSGSEPGTCGYDVIDKLGNKHAIHDIVGTEYIGCTMGWFDWYSQNFIGWSGPDKIIFSIKSDSEGERDLQIVDISSRRLEVLTYDTYKMVTSKEMNGAEGYILFEEKGSLEGDGKAHPKYLLFQSSEPFNEVKRFGLDTGTINNEIAFYDQMSNLYIFITRDYEHISEDRSSYDLVSLNVYTFDIEDLSLRGIIPTYQYEIYGGRGCGLIKAVSEEPGTVIIDSGGCFEVPEQYKYKDYYMKIPLK